MTHEQEEQVRRALGSLPPVGPTPPDVVRRLDDTLADLVAERGEGPLSHQDSRRVADEVADGSADELAARRRRRWRTGLVAAASVAVLGVGIGTVVDDLSTGGADSLTAGDAGVAEQAPGAAREDAPNDAAGGGAAEYGVAAGTELLVGPPRELSSATLKRDVERVAALSPLATTAKDGRLEAFSDRDDTAPQAAPRAGAQRRVPGTLARCDLPATARGDRLAPVRLDGVRATLLLRKPVAGTHEAEIYACGDGERRLATTVVRAP